MLGSRVRHWLFNESQTSFITGDCFIAATFLISFPRARVLAAKPGVTSELCHHQHKESTHHIKQRETDTWKKARGGGGGGEGGDRWEGH